MCFFFNDTATTEIYTLSLHDALPIYGNIPRCPDPVRLTKARPTEVYSILAHGSSLSNLLLLMASKIDKTAGRSEEHTSELQSPDHLVCLLLLDKQIHHM